MNAKVSIGAEDLVKISAASIGKVDIELMFDIAKSVAENPALLDKFDRNPEAAAYAINGFVVPPGFHMHIVDGNNHYHPAEADALSQISSKDGGQTWTRIETRAGYANIACVICLWCS